jgi:hypothetical protein
MPRPSKRAIASRAVGSIAAKKRKVTVVDGDWEVPDSGPSEGELSRTDSDSDLYSSGPEDGELSEEEDIFPIGQPAEGWQEAERKLAGYSKTRVYKQKLSYHRNKEEIKRRRDEKIAQTSGIPVGEKPKPVYADILQYFKPSETLLSNIPIENQSRQSTSPYVAFSSSPSPERIDTLLPPPSWEPFGLLVGKGCCALRILEAEDDFRNEVSLLETVIRAAGHEVIFYPKFHCELNYIEYYWAALKRYTRENCRYSFLELEATVLEGMNFVGLKTIRRFAMRSKRWMMAYMNGLSEEQRAYAEKQYKSHRREARQIFV